MLVIAMLLAGTQPLNPAAAPKPPRAPAANSAATQSLPSSRVRELERIVSLLASDGPPRRMEGPTGM
ncbi:MAG TPA: hypothetical protein VGB62_10580 [Allosphingosinicella sp.]|jgi:hypothetical protein